MAISYEPDMTLFQEAFTGMSIIGRGYIIPLVLTFLICVIVTRNPNKWKIMAFPILVGLAIIQLEVSPVVLILAGIVFVIEILSAEVIGSALSTFTNNIIDKIIPSKTNKIRTMESKLHEATIMDKLGSRLYSRDDKKLKKIIGKRAYYESMGGWEEKRQIQLANENKKKLREYVERMKKSGGINAVPIAFNDPYSFMIRRKAEEDQ